MLTCAEVLGEKGTPEAYKRLPMSALLENSGRALGKCLLKHQPPNHVSESILRQTQQNLWQSNVYDLLARPNPKPPEPTLRKTAAHKQDCEASWQSQYQASLATCIGVGTGKGELEALGRASERPLRAPARVSTGHLVHVLPSCDKLQHVTTCCNTRQEASYELWEGA